MSIFFGLFDGFVLFFQKLSVEMCSGFLFCNQCIKTLFLSYQKSPTDNFIFYLCKGRAVFENSAHMTKIGWNSNTNIFRNSRAKGMQWQMGELLISFISMVCKNKHHPSRQGVIIAGESKTANSCWYIWANGIWQSVPA